MSVLIGWKLFIAAANGFLNNHHLLGARNRELSDGNVARGATCVCRASFHLLQESKNRDVDSSAVAVQVPHLVGKKPCTNGEETAAELLVEEGLIECGEFGKHQRRRNSTVRQLLTD